VKWRRKNYQFIDSPTLTMDHDFAVTKGEVEHTLRHPEKVRFKCASMRYRFSVPLPYVSLQFHHPVCTSSTVPLTVYLMNGEDAPEECNNAKGGIYLYNYVFLPMVLQVLQDYASFSSLQNYASL
jgi:hypothetical protein